MPKTYFKNRLRMPWYVYGAVLLILALPGVFVSAHLIQAVYVCRVYRAGDFVSVCMGDNGDYVRLRGYAVMTHDKVSLNAELYMPGSDGQAPSGLFALDQRLRPLASPKQGECYVSRKLAQKYRLRLNGSVTVKAMGLNGKPITVKIAGYLPSVNGLKNSTTAQGIVLIGYDESAASSSREGITFFEQELSGKEVVTKAGLLKEQRRIAYRMSLWVLAAATVGIFVTEVVFQQDKVTDYTSLYRKGIGRKKLIGVIAVELLIKYALLTAIAGLIPSLVFVRMYGGTAFLYMAALVSAGLICFASLTVYYMLRLKRWIR